MHTNTNTQNDMKASSTLKRCRHVHRILIMMAIMAMTMIRLTVVIMLITRFNYRRCVLVFAPAIDDSIGFTWRSRLMLVLV